MAISVPVFNLTDTSGRIAILILPLLLLFPPLFFIFLSKPKGKAKNLPPGPPGLPILGNLLHLKLSGCSFEDWIQKLHAEYGPIFTVRIGTQPMIFIASHELAHKALSEKGSIFADRPPAHGSRKLFSSNQHSINSAPYGALWRLLRRNLLTQALNPSALYSYKPARERAIQALIQALHKQSAHNNGIVRRVVENFRSAVFCILVYMCFGFQPEEKAAKDVETALRELLLSGGGLGFDEVFPVFGTWFGKRRRRRMQEIRRAQVKSLLPLIEERRRQLATQEGVSSSAYVDSLVSLVLPDGRKLSDDEMVTLCSEFINAGTDTTSTALQWVMANLVIHQNVQSKLYEEILGVVGTHRDVEEEDVQRMAYLNAVVKEGLRRHPPGHFVLPHAVTQECTFAGYTIPTYAYVNFYIAGMSHDPNLWENPSDFVPERFMGADHTESDMGGSKETKMVVFGAGRRICPGSGLALFHLHLMVARLVQSFEWLCVPGETVDLSEKDEFTTVMKNPLSALLKQRPSIHGLD